MTRPRARNWGVGIAGIRGRAGGCIGKLKGFTRREVIPGQFERGPPVLVRRGADVQLIHEAETAPTLEKRVLRTVLEEVVADMTDDPPTVHLKL
jgi:hypothetical protein